MSLLEEKLAPRRHMPPLLLQLSERPAEKLDYLGVSYGLTPELLRYMTCSYGVLRYSTCASLVLEIGEKID